MKYLNPARLVVDEETAAKVAKARHVRAKGAARASTYKERQAALGRRQRPLWLADEEFSLVKRALEELRALRS